jgi:uncharacterized protein
MENIDKELIRYIEDNIIPQYSAFDKGHNIDHVQKVIKDSLYYCNKINDKTINNEYQSDLPVRTDLVYVIAAYHDLGLSSGREEHHIKSGEILEKDVTLRRWFSAEEIQTMKEAVEDHRASNKYAPQSIYGKIVAEADRDISLETILYRTVAYSINKYPDYNFDQIFERTYSHILNKYGENGYLKLWLNTPKNIAGLNDIREMLKTPQKMRMHTELIYLTKFNRTK